jgi:hypothetical protein
MTNIATENERNKGIGGSASLSPLSLCYFP